MTKDRVGGWLTAASLVVIGLLTLLPTGTRPSRLLSCIVCGDRGTVDVLLNALLFIPLGTGLRMRGARILEALFVALMISVCIETAQLLVVTGRTASPGDVITNTAGGALGAMLAPVWRMAFHPSPRRGLVLGIAGGTLWIASLAFAAWAMQPQLWSTRLFAQIRPPIPRPADRYPGEVDAMWVNGEPMPGGWIGGDVRRAARLDEVPGELSSTLRYRAPASSAVIVRVVDERRRTRLELRVADADLVFEPSLRATSLRLSRPAIRLPSAFSTRNGTELLRASGGLRDGTMHVALDDGHAPARADAELRATLGWVLLLPMSYALGPEAPWLTAAWIAAVVLTWGYWLGAAMRGRHARPVIGVGVATIVIGLAIVPLLFGAPATTRWEWAVALGTFAFGASRGRARIAAAQSSQLQVPRLGARYRKARPRSRGVARRSSE